MRITILGAGALGRAYAAALHGTGCQVSLRSRHGHGPYRFSARRLGMFPQERVIHLERVHELAESDVILVCVRADSVNAEMIEQLEAVDTPIVVFTPMLDAATSALWARLPKSVIGMPNLLATWRDDALRYWIPPLSATILDLEAKRFPATRLLREHLCRAGIGARFVAETERMSRATTTAFLPLQAAAAAVPRVEDWYRDKKLIRTVSAGLRITRRIARQLGKVEPGIRLGSWLLSSPLTLSLFSRHLVRLVPGAPRYLDDHFGGKLISQTTSFARQVGELAARVRLPTDQEAQLATLMHELSRRALSAGEGDNG